MSERLTTLPWVESDSIKTEAKKRQVKFTVKDRAKFNMDDLQQALGDRYANGVKLLTGPTEPGHKGAPPTGAAPAKK